MILQENDIYIDAGKKIFLLKVSFVEYPPFFK